MTVILSLRRISESTDVNATVNYFKDSLTSQDHALGHSSNPDVLSEETLVGLQQQLLAPQSLVSEGICGDTFTGSLPLIRYLSGMSQELSNHSEQIQQLRAALEQSRSIEDRESVRHDVESVTDVFFDCVSRLPENELGTSLERLQNAFCGSPNPYFESSPLFYPEQYTTEDLFDDQFSVHATIQWQEDTRVQKLFITYAQARRRWRRIVVSATFLTNSRDSLFPYSVYDDRDLFSKALPKRVYVILNSLLPGLELYDSITHLSLPLLQDDSGVLTSDYDGTETSEDSLEIARCDEDQILQDINDMGCPTFLESEVVTRSRMTATRFVAFVESTMCMERKVPFPSAAAQGRNGFQGFYHDLKLLHSLRGCQHYVQLIGVVLDDSRRHLRSYLYDDPIYSMEQLFEFAEIQNVTIPWNVREVWAKQIVTAISDIHGKGVTISVGEFHCVKVRLNGSIALCSHLSVPQASSKRRGHQAPELRSDQSEEALPGPLTFRANVFTLGLILWQLAEHTAHLCGYLCQRSDCTNTPRYACKAPHTNPIELPDLHTGVPQYYREMVRKCRSVDPGARPSARELLASFPEEIRNGSLPPGVGDIPKMFPAIHSSANVYCDECGIHTPDDHYHCSICNEDDLDFCPACIGRGLHCYDPEHQLTRRGPKARENASF